MPNVQEIKIPDIGDFEEVTVIEVMVKPGDTIKPEDPLVTLESDKATMDVPSPAAGQVKDVKLKVGDKIKPGSLILMLETSDVVTASAPPPPPKPSSPATPPPVAKVKETTQSAEPPKAKAPTQTAKPLAGATTYTGKIDGECEVLVLGSGPGGYSAAFRAADLGKKTVLVERYATLGGVCLNVGCIPSKALLHVAAVTDEAKKLAEHGVAFGTPKFDLAKLRAWKDKVVGKLVGGVGTMAKGRKVEVIRGNGKFIDARHMEIALTDGKSKKPTGEKKIIRFGSAIIAAGSESVKLPFIPDDPRIVDSTGAIELPNIPKKMLVIGGGIIGLEMANVYSSLGSRIDVVEMLDGLMLGADRDLVRVWEKLNSHRFDHIMLKTKTTKVEAQKSGIKVTFEGEQAPKEPQVYDFVLVAVGRTPNGKNIGAEKAGVAVSDRGFIQVDKQMRTNVPHIFAIGDIAGAPMLAHKAVHEGHVAAEAAAGQKSFFDAVVIPSVAYTDPEIAWVGLTEDEAKKQGRNVGKARFPWVASGRAIANGRDEGFTKILVDEESHRVVGGGIVGTNAGDLISELALAIEMGCDPEDIGKTIHPHPTLSESVGMVAEVFEGVCTDLMPSKRR